MKKTLFIIAMLISSIIILGCSNPFTEKEESPYKIIREDNPIKDHYNVVVLVEKNKTDQELYTYALELIPILQKKYSSMNGLYISFTNLVTDDDFYTLGRIKYDPISKQIVSSTLAVNTPNIRPDKKDFELFYNVVNNYIAERRAKGDDRAINVLISEALKSNKSKLTVDQFNELAIKIMKFQ